MELQLKKIKNSPLNIKLKVKNKNSSRKKIIN